uniref:Uncharacterized protein n=1 Tax=Anopheles funestus TaxID=62324 RepID=A0A4Y0BDV0_ANOFN
MASEKIRQRAETALEYAKDFLLDDESEAEDDTVEDDEEIESENGNEEDDHDENDAKENDDEKAKETKSDKDPKSKKSSKGITKKVQKLMGVVMDPFGSKINWNFDFNLGVKASNRKEKREGKMDPNTGTAGSTSGKTADKECDNESLSFDAKRIKILEKDNKLLQKYASKFLDGCIRLEQKVSELSKLEGQLAASQADNDRLKSELHDLQDLKQGLIRNLDTQNEKHRNEVKRLDLELNTATESLAKMKLTNQKQLEESCRLRADLESLAKEKEGLIKKSEQREISYSSELNNLMESLQQTKLENTELTERVHKLTDNLQITAEQMKESKTKNMQLEQKLRETQSEKHKINAQLDATNTKITELRRAIQILESNPFTTTTAQLQSEGTFTCPLCGASFGSLANMQLHAEDCNG